MYRLCACVTLSLLLSAPLAAREPVRARDWRPMTAQELALPTWAAPLPVLLPDAPRTDTLQWVQIDPATGAILSTPAPPAARAPLLSAAEPASTFILRTNSRGHLLLQTRGLRSVMRAHHGATGALHVDCVDASHGHALPAPTTGTEP